MNQTPQITAYEAARYSGASEDACQEAWAADVAAQSDAKRIKRLRLAAIALDDEAERHMEAAAKLADRIAFCRQIPEGRSEPRNTELADSLERERENCIACAHDAQDKAWPLKLQAVEIEMREEPFSDLVEAVRSVVRAA